MAQVYTTCIYPYYFLISTLPVDIRVSKQPGCTTSVNYYAFLRKSGAHRVYMIDLPGYGFAKASRSERRKWQSTMKTFLSTRDFKILRYIYTLQKLYHINCIIYLRLILNPKAVVNRRCATTA